MEIKDIKAVYFVGAGGIGMSAIARYFIHRGLVVAGYDKTPSDLTRQLEKEGMSIHYEECVDAIPEACRLVLEAGSMGNGGEIYIFDMGKPVKILDLAKQMISLSGRTDVQIKFTGLRHGEKLYEVLLNDKEHTKPTYNEKIMIADVREYDYDEVKVKIHELEDIAATYDQMKIVEKMKELVPEYVSKNSIFEQLDHKNNE